TGQSSAKCCSVECSPMRALSTDPWLPVPSTVPDRRAILALCRLWGWWTPRHGLARSISRTSRFRICRSASQHTPACILLCFLGIRILASLEPEGEPVQIALVHRTAMDRLPLDVCLFREDVHFDRFVLLAKRAERLERQTEFLVGKLHEERRVDR